MMQTLLLFLLIVSMFVSIWLQFRYKNANYPNTWKWRLSLFLSGFLLACFGGAFFMAGAPIEVLVISMLGGGIFGGIIFAYASPHSMKGLYPKRPKNEQ